MHRDPGLGAAAGRILTEYGADGWEPGGVWAVWRYLRRPEVWRALAPP